MYNILLATAVDSRTMSMLVRKGQLLFTYFHFACEKELTDAMLKDVEQLLRLEKE
jgi:alanine dehydrogenase